MSTAASPRLHYRVGLSRQIAPAPAKTPLGGRLQRLYLAERPKQKYALFSAGNIFTYCDSYKAPRRVPGLDPSKLAYPGRELFLGTPPAFSSDDSNNLSAYSQFGPRPGWTVLSRLRK